MACEWMESLPSDVCVDGVAGWLQVKVLGSGGFGVVHLWRNEETRESIALKQCKVYHEMTPKHLKRWRDEVNIMQRLSHNNVVKALPVPEPLMDPTVDQPVMAMEYCDGGDMRKILRLAKNCCGLEEYQIRTLARHVGNGIEYLHSNRIIHRDLKPENIVVKMIDEKAVYKIIDLGYAKDLDQGSVCSSFVGTLYYVAPELYSSPKYTSTVDYWSFGILLYECITGFRPFFHYQTPFQWHNEMKANKKKEHICAYYDMRNKPVYSRTIPPPHGLCKASQTSFESWLQLMLNWDPEERGGDTAYGSSRRKQCFQLLEEILDTKLVFILCMPTNILLPYPVTLGQTVADLQAKLEQEMHIPIQNQELLLASGSPLEASTPASQYAAETGEEECLVFLFKKDDKKFSHYDRQLATLPHLVNLMIGEPQINMTYRDQKTTWGRAVNYCSSAAKAYRRLVQGERALVLNVLRMHATVSQAIKTLEADSHKLKAKLEFFKDSIDFDLAKYKEQTESGVTSQKLFSSWSRLNEKIIPLHALVKGTSQLSDQYSRLSTKVIEMERSPFRKHNKQDVLQDVEKTSFNLYNDLRDKDRAVEDRSREALDNKEMVKLVLDCKEKQAKVMADLCQSLGNITRELHYKIRTFTWWSSVRNVANLKITEVKTETIELMQQLQGRQQHIQEADTSLSQCQRIRQNDMWRLLKIMVSRVNDAQSPMRGLDTPCGPIDASIMPTSSMMPSAEPCPPSVIRQPRTMSTSSTNSAQSMMTTSVMNMLDKSAEQSLLLVQENVDTRNRLASVVQNITQCPIADISNQVSDWSFLNKGYESSSS